ncbi:hypothetical protein BCEP27_140014 [Burkholderia cepacia]
MMSKGGRWVSLPCDFVLIGHGKLLESLRLNSNFVTFAPKQAPTKRVQVTYEVLNHCWGTGVWL